VCVSLTGPRSFAATPTMLAAGAFGLWTAMARRDQAEPPHWRRLVDIEQAAQMGRLAPGHEQRPPSVHWP
jgi:hypothetical protein